MKKIRIKFKGLCYCSHTIVSIFYSNKLVLNKEVSNNELEICLEECKAYKIVIISNGRKLISSFYVDNSNTYIFSFVNSMNNTITFILTDFNYNNLPIERGELLLWQSQ